MSGAASFSSLCSPQTSLERERAGEAVRPFLEGSTNLVNWTKLMARTSAGGTAQYTDTRATNYTKRFYRLVVP